LGLRSSKSNQPKYAYAYANRGTVRHKQGAIADWKKAASLYKAQGNQKSYQDVVEVLQALGVR
jgi:hypothetical protein